MINIEDILSLANHFRRLNFNDCLNLRESWSERIICNFLNFYVHLFKRFFSFPHGSLFLPLPKHCLRVSKAFFLTACKYSRTVLNSFSVEDISI